ncbi:MAG: hypothetical protein ABFD29_01645 [Anaerolineaceae bacterium]
MKKVHLLVVITVLLGLAMTTMQVYANSGGVKPTPKPEKVEKTSGMKATEVAALKPEKFKPEIYKGTVTEVTLDSLTLKMWDESTLQFRVNDKTRVKIPTVKGATVAEINLGVNATIHAYHGEEENLVAESIQIVPGKPLKIHRVGVVTAYTEAESITIQAKDGELYTFALSSGTKILPLSRIDQLGVGTKVTIISRRDPTGGALAAQGIVIHPEIMDGSETEEPGETIEPSETPEETEPVEPSETEEIE